MNDSKVEVTPDPLKLLGHKLRGMGASQLSTLKHARNVLAHAARADEGAERALAEANRLLAGVAASSAVAGELKLTGAIRNSTWSLTSQVHSQLYHIVAAPVDATVIAVHRLADDGIAYTSLNRCPISASHEPADDGIVLTAPSPDDQIYVVAFFEDDVSKYIVTSEDLRVCEAPPDPKKVLLRLFRKLLRVLNRLIAQFIRLLDGLTSSSELVEKFRPFLMTHGNHPPDVSASLASSFSA